MKAILYPEYGPPDVLQLQEVAKPVPKENEVLVKVCAAAVNAADWHLMRGEPAVMRLGTGLRRPKNPRLGADAAGWVEAVGHNVKELQPGDEVFGNVTGYGAFAEYICVPETHLVKKPENASFAEAAAVPLAGVTALQALRDKGRIQPGQHVLINGASGGVGTFAIQLAKAFGAEITAVCSTRNVEAARRLGADHVLDYKQGDITGSGTYDIILAANGYQPISAYRRMLKPNGVYVMSGGANAQFFQAFFLGPLFSLTSGKKMGNLMLKQSRDDLLVMKELIETGKVVPVIDRTYTLEEVPAAVRYMEEGHARGKVVIVVG